MPEVVELLLTVVVLEESEESLPEVESFELLPEDAARNVIESDPDAEPVVVLVASPVCVMSNVPEPLFHELLEFDAVLTLLPL